MKKIIRIAFPLVSFGLIGFSSCKKEAKKDTNAPVRVETITVAESALTTGRTYSGVIEESTGTVLSFKIPGTISAIEVAEGQHVSKGQLIAEIDDASLRSNLRIAQSALATARDTYDRMKKLHDVHAISEMKWVEVQNALTAAESAEHIAHNALTDTRIYSPISGYVSERFADVGSTVAPAAPVVKVVEISPLKICISVPESEIGSIGSSTTAAVTVQAAGNACFTAEFAEKGVATNPLSRSYTVKFNTDNPDGIMLPGMLCTVNLMSAAASTGIVVPTGAVMLGAGNETYVWTVTDGKADKRTVTLGNYTPEGVVIEQGLEAGDTVIAKGQQKVCQGLEIQPIN